MSTEQTINDIFAAQKQWFQAGNTRDITVRMAALRKLRQVILDNKPAIYAALESDLGKTPRQSVFSGKRVVLSLRLIFLSYPSFFFLLSSSDFSLRH